MNKIKALDIKYLEKNLKNYKGQYAISLSPSCNEKKMNKVKAFLSILLLT